MTTPSAFMRLDEVPQGQVRLWDRENLDADNPPP